MSARRAEVAQAVLGNDEASGRPCARLCAGAAGPVGVPTGARTALAGAARSATRVPEPLPGGQPALGDQFRVGVGGRVPGDSEVGGERPVGRQPDPGRQPPLLDGLAQGLGEGGPARARPGQHQVQVGADAFGRIDP
ncbi:hypothetical protein GCM10020254_01200 [Streptomyces goshikiensis]